MATVVLEHLATQGIGIDEIAVVSERNAVGRIDVQGLGLAAALGPGGRIAAVADADTAAQGQHVFALEHVLDEPVALVQSQARAVNGGDARRVLAAMLEHGQGIVESRCDFGFADDSNDSTHGSVHCAEVG